MTDVLSRDEALRAHAGRLSLEQKIRLLTGADFWSTYPEPTIGLKRMVLSDGAAVGLPEDMVWRHPFPGPGLSIRVLGEVTAEPSRRSTQPIGS